MRPLALIALSPLVLLASACGPKEEVPELQRFASCEELHSWAKTSARRDIEFTGNRYGGWGGPFGFDGAERGGAVPPASPTQDLGTNGGGAGSYTTTNVQVDGVDEADFVKNDGEHAFVLDTAGLSVLDIWPTASLQEIARVPVEGQPDSLFFDGEDTLVVFSSLWNGVEASPASGATLAEDAWSSRWSWDPITKITVLDVTDRSAPSTQREIYVDGTLRTSRRIGEAVHVVLTNTLQDVYEPTTYSGLPGAYNSARLRKLSTTVAADWVPRLQDNRAAAGAWTTDEGPATACTDVYKPNVRTDLVFTNVLTLDLGDPTGDLVSAGVFTRADTVFASADSLYLAMAEWDNGPFRSLDGSLDSRVHKLDLRGDAPVYTASGLVPGTMLNQFSMDEHDGFLRVATTDRNAQELSSGVFVMEQVDTELVPVGSVIGLAPGESIYAARFQGDKGYIVTFEQIDPLFTLDLSDPRDPQVRGELEVTGFSNYLHPLPDGRLLAVGEEIDASGFEWLGLQVSLFDVSDLDAPRLEDRAIVSGQGWSEAQYDHHAFTWYAEHGVLSLPVQRWNQSTSLPANALALFSVEPGADDPIVTLDEVDHSSWLQEELGGDEDDQWRWCAQVRRSIWLEDQLLTVSNMGIQVTSLDAPDTTTASWIAPDGGCQGWWGAW